MEAVVKFINKHYKFNFENAINRKSFSGTLADFVHLYDTEKELVRLKLAMDAEHFEVAAIKAKGFLGQIETGTLSGPVRQILSGKSTKGKIIRQMNRLLSCHSLVDAVIRESGMTEAQLLSRETAFDDVVSGSTKFFQFTPGQLTFDTNFQMHKAIVVSSTNRSIIDSLPETSPGETKCYLVFKVESELAYSHFIFAFVSGSTKVIATDKTLFATPNIAERTRNPWRKVESKFNTGLPYEELFAMVENSKAVTTTAGQFFDVFNIEDCKDAGIYVRSFAQMIFRVLVATDNVPNVQWSADVKRLLIESGESPAQAAEQEGLTGWGISSQKRFEEITGAAELRHLPALATWDIEAAKDDDWFDTPEALKKRAVWMSLDKSAKAIQASLPRGELIKDILRPLFEEKAESVREKFLSALTVYWVQCDYTSANRGFGFSLAQSKSESKFTFISVREKMEWSEIDISKTVKRDRWHTDFICPITGAKANMVIRARIISAAQIAWLLDIPKSELPQMWRAYKQHSLLPYTGNSILDSVHPYALVNDHASEKYPNGITVVFGVSKSGYKKIMKGKPEATTLFYDVDTDLVEIVAGAPEPQEIDNHGVVINFYRG